MPRRARPQRALARALAAGTATTAQHALVTAVDASLQVGRFQTSWHTRAPMSRGLDSRRLDRRITSDVGVTDAFVRGRVIERPSRPDVAETSEVRHEAGSPPAVDSRPGRSLGRLRCRGNSGEHELACDLPASADPVDADGQLTTRCSYRCPDLRIGYSLHRMRALNAIRNQKNQKDLL